MRRSAGFTLLEVLVSISIVALIGVLIYGAFSGMARSRDNIRHMSDRYQQGRGALDRMAREIGSAFLSAHVPVDTTVPVRNTAFIGSDALRGDRVDFTAFAHQRLMRDSHESDQAEISYFVASDPETGHGDLVRRVDKYIDDDPTRGGLVQVLAQNVESFEISYLDPISGEWIETWDSTQPAAQLGRLPSQVWIRLVLADGPGGGPVTFETKAPLSMQLPLTFAAGG